MTNEGNKYFAEEGKFIVRKEDGFIMGEDIDLGSEDSIKNYEEKAYTEEECDAFYKSIGMPNPHKKQDERINRRPIRNER